MSQQDGSYLDYFQNPVYSRPHILALTYIVEDPINYVLAGKDMRAMDQLCERLLGQIGPLWWRKSMGNFHWHFLNAEDAMLVKLAWENG